MLYICALIMHTRSFSIVHPIALIHTPPLSLPDKCIQFTALTWIKMFLSLAQRSMMVFTSNILVSILPCVAYDNDKARILQRNKIVVTSFLCGVCNSQCSLG